MDPRTRTTGDPDPDPSPSPHYEPSSFPASSPPSIFLAFLVLLAALFSLCLAAAAARRLIASLSDARRPTPQPAPPRRSRVPAARGMDLAAVGSLPVIAYVGPSGGEWCAVCLGELEAKERVKPIPRCGHVFHPACIDRWLVARGSCPVCRCASDMAVCEGRDLGVST